MGCGSSAAAKPEQPVSEKHQPDAAQEKKPEPAVARPAEPEKKPEPAPTAAKPTEPEMKEEPPAVDHRGTIDEQEAAALKIQNEARRKAALEKVAKRKAEAAVDPSAASKGHAARAEDKDGYDAKLMAGKKGKVDVAAVKSKTRGALLGGLKSGALEAAVEKMEADEAAAEEAVPAAEEAVPAAEEAAVSKEKSKMRPRSSVAVRPLEERNDGVFDDTATHAEGGYVSVTKEEAATIEEAAPGAEEAAPVLLRSASRRESLEHAPNKRRPRSSMAVSQDLGNSVMFESTAKHVQGGYVSVNDEQASPAAKVAAPAEEAAPAAKVEAKDECEFVGAPATEEAVPEVSAQIFQDLLTVIEEEPAPKAE